MSPFEFVSAYHNLTVHDPRLGISFTGRIWMYVSGKTGGKSLRTGEYNAVMSAISGRLKAGGPSMVPATFYIKDDPLMDPTEPFYQPGIRRAFAGRGSPEEIADATRLAVLTKRCKAYDAKKYMEGWFGQDCNSFVGNYQGVSPNHSIRAWAMGYHDHDDIGGATTDVYVTEGLLPLPLITDPSKVTQGSVIVTDSSERQFRHIALVQSFQLLTAGTKPVALIEVAEWGVQSKSESAHARPMKNIELLVDTLTPGMGKTKVLAFKGSEPGHLRFFLDASKLDDLPHRGWHVGNKDGV